MLPTELVGSRSGTCNSHCRASCAILPFRTSCLDVSYASSVIATCRPLLGLSSLLRHVRRDYNVKLIILTHLVSRFRMCGDLSPRLLYTICNVVLGNGAVLSLRSSSPPNRGPSSETYAFSYTVASGGILSRIKWPEGVPKKTKLRGLSPQANYTDRATAACRRS
jgi:hypothetical protein